MLKNKVVLDKMLKNKDGSLAQLVEQRTLNPFIFWSIYL